MEVLQDSIFGDDLKKEGMARAHAATPEDFYTRIRAEARAVSRMRGEVASDDLRFIAQRLGIAPETDNGWGSVFSEKGWTFVRHRNSRWPDAHARTIKVWRWDG